MRKVLVIFVLLFTLYVKSTTFATSDINIVIDNQVKSYNPGPIIQNEYTLVPMRAIFEDLGAQIYWYDSTKSVTATRDTIKIKLTIGSDEGFVNNNKVVLSVKPQIIDDKTYVPLRFISESLGAQVNWDDKTRTITIKDKIKVESKNPVLLDTQKYELRTTYSFVNYGDNVNLEFLIVSGAQSTSPYQKDSNITINPIPEQNTLDEYGNQNIKIKTDNLKNGEEFNIVVSKQLSNSGIKYDIDKDNISNDYSMLPNYSNYISPQLMVESDNDKIIQESNNIAGNDKNPYEIAKKVYEFVNMSLTYDLDQKYAGKGALSALQTKRGVCEEFSDLFTAMLRAKQIPSRTVFGVWLDQDLKNNIGYEWYDVSDKKHQWSEFYIPQNGWVIVEPTYFYSINGERTVPWNQFANQDNNGHIISGYRANIEDFRWSIEGRGKRDVRLSQVKVEIRKVK